MADEGKIMPRHLALIPSPGMGHLIPLFEFANRLIHPPHNYTVTFIVPSALGSSTEAYKSELGSLPPSIDVIYTPQIDIGDLPEDARAETRISQTMTRSVPYVKEVLVSLVVSSKLVAVVIDIFSTDLIDVSRELGVPPYIFFTSSAMCLSFLLYLPELDETVSCEYRELEEPIRLPGCIPIKGENLLAPVQDRTNDAYNVMLRLAKRHRDVDGIILNSFSGVEERAIRALTEDTKTPPVYPIGPVIKIVSPPLSDDEEENECLRWLHNQPRGSVMYVSFGSGGSLSHRQIAELALGLELSGQRFLWVLRNPSDVANASFLNSRTTSNPLDHLPEGFLKRTRDRGLVVPSWAPQARVLGHGSVSVFLSHCGWNSALESIANGVPMIAWPLYAEQKMNAVLLADDIKVALRPTVDPCGVVTREAVAEVVRRLMEEDEGKKVRMNVKRVQEDSAMSLRDTGESSLALLKLVSKWKSHLH